MYYCWDGDMISSDNSRKWLFFRAFLNKYVRPVSYCDAGRNRPVEPFCKIFCHNEGNHIFFFDNSISSLSIDIAQYNSLKTLVINLICCSTPNMKRMNFSAGFTLIGLFSQKLQLLLRKTEKWSRTFDWYQCILCQPTVLNHFCFKNDNHIIC